MTKSLPWKIARSDMICLSQTGICIRSKLFNYQRISSFQAHLCQMPPTCGGFTGKIRGEIRGWFILSYHSSHLEDVSLEKRWPGGSLCWGPHPSWVDQRSVETDHATVISIRCIYESMTLSAVPVCLVGAWSVYFFHYAVYRPKREFG